MNRKTAKKTAKKSTGKRAQSTTKSISPEKKKRGRTGRPPFKPDERSRKQVEMMAAMGMRLEEMCLLIENPTTGKPIDDKTLRRHFKREIESGAPKANLNVARSLYQKATGDGPQAVTAAIWYSKCRMGWKERSVVEVESKSGVLVAPARVTPEEWIADTAKRSAEIDEPPQ